MDSDDERDLSLIWTKFDRRMNDIYERETHKFMLTLDKAVRERLGWRGKKPEDDYERFQIFMDFVNDVYLTPSIYWNDCTSSDRDSIHGADGSQE
jgi:hypothetical protein